MVAAVRRAAMAILNQKAALLQAVKPPQYTEPCALVGGGSIGQHLRHSLDHYHRCLQAASASASAPAAGPLTIQYDVRDRGTSIEKDLGAARKEVQRLLRAVEALPDAALETPVKAAFILSAEGESQALPSTLGRELGFCTHHAIHHNALIKTIATAMEVEGVAQIRDFGMAPSTAHYNKTHPAPQ